MMSGHIWAQLPRPDLPPQIVISERAFEAVYQSRRPLLHQLGLVGSGSFLAILLVSAAAYLWNNRRLPDPPSPRTTARGHMSAIFDGVAQRLLVRRPLVRAGFFFTVRVLARSVQNRLSIAIPMAVAVALAAVTLRPRLGSSLDLSSVPIALSAVQCCLSRQCEWLSSSVRVPAESAARWLFHLVRPANQSAIWRGQSGPRSSSVFPVCWHYCRYTSWRSPTNRHPALHMLAQRARAQRGLPAGISPTALCIQLRSNGGRDDLRGHLRITLLDWCVHVGPDRAPGAEHHGRYGRALCRHWDRLGRHPWNGRVAAARSC